MDDEMFVSDVLGDLAAWEADSLWNIDSARGSSRNLSIEEASPSYDGVRDFTELRVWQAGIDLAVLIYQTTAEFPKEELYGLTSQLRRAAVSVPSNIAEGNARNRTGDVFFRLLEVL